MASVAERNYQLADAPEINYVKIGVKSHGSRKV
jgi:hypothetical protein